MALPKYEGMITVPSGGYTMTVTDAGGTSAVTVAAAGDYYLTSTTSLLSAIASALNADATLSATYTITLDDNDDNSASSTGRVTIATSSSMSAITWTSTALRDLLGFSGSEVISSGTVTADYHSRYLYLPNTKRSNALCPDGDDGLPESDGVVTRSTSGYTKSLSYNITKRDVIEHQFLLGSKVWDSLDTYTNEALQTFYAYVVGKGVPFRYHPDRATDGTYVSYQPDTDGVQSMNVAPMVDGWTSGAMSLWRWRCPVWKKL